MDIPYEREQGALGKPVVSQGYFMASGGGHDIEAIKKKLAETSLLLEVLTQVNHLMGRYKSFNGFCKEVSTILMHYFGFKYIHIWVRDESDPTQLKLVTPEKENVFRTMSIEEGLIGMCIRESRTICAPDVLLVSTYRNVHPETKSEVCIPLLYEGKPLGVLNIEADTRQTFDGTITLLEVIAENLSQTLRIALLHQMEENFHNLVEQMSEGVALTDEDGKVNYTNRALQQMTLRNEDELHGISLYELFDSQSHENLKKINEGGSRTGHIEGVLLSKEDKKINVLINIIPVGISRRMATITDMRALKTAERKLRQTEQYLASITQHCQEAIAGIDEKGIILSWNVGAERMFGYRTDEVLNKNTEIIFPEDRIIARELESILQEAVIKGFVHNFETIALHKNGKPILISLTLSAIRDEQNYISGFSALYRDITSQKKWEREIQDRFEKMQDAYREMGKQRRYLDYLMEMITIASGPGSTLKQLATFIVNAIVMMTRVDAATMRVMDRATGKLVLVSQNGVNEDWWSKKSIPYNGSLVETAYKNGTPLKILDILTNRQYTAPALARKNNLRSALVIPLEAKGEVLGSLSLYLSHEGNLSLLDDEFITIFGKQASIALKIVNP